MKSQQYTELYGLLKTAFIEMQELVRSSKENHKIIFSQHDFPKLNSVKENGMPSLSTYFFADGPKDFSSLFKSNDEYHYYYRDLESFKAVLDYFNENKDAFKEHLYFRALDKNVPLYQHIFAYDLLEAFDSYMHSIDSDEFCESTFREVLFRLFFRFFEDNLPVSICIPILLTRFQGDEFIVSEGVRIRKLSDKELLSIYSKGGYSDTYELLLISSATHVLELQNYSSENAPVFSPRAWDYIESYPVELVDKWFAAYRIITGNPTGYGQLLAFPINWGVRNGNLIDVHGVKIQKYPHAFINQRLDAAPTPIVSKNDLDTVGMLFRSLVESKANSLDIAVKRLNMAYLRDVDEDSIIDLMIGIEALVVGKDEFGEISYKVSTRTAFILSTLSAYPYTIRETVDHVKKMYRFRSKVVHGETIPEPLKIIKLQEDSSISTVNLARTVLEFLILAISAKPDLSDPTRIDAYFQEKYESLIKDNPKVGT